MDGGVSKYITDALVDCGVLRGDGPEDVAEIHYRQRKKREGEEEETVVEVWEDVKENK